MKDVCSQASLCKSVRHPSVDWSPRGKGFTSGRGGSQAAATPTPPGLSWPQYPITAAVVGICSLNCAAFLRPSFVATSESF